MKRYNYKFFWVPGIITLLASFIILFSETKWVLLKDIQGKNLLAFAILSLIFAIPAALLSLFRLKIALVIYYISLFIGFGYMLSIFNADMAGWGDLAGLMSLFFIYLFGLGISLIAQFVWYVFRKYRNPKPDLFK
ncbi:MAG: hypothetical protein A2Y17_08440 [Clostridiales bacterium GWF2_38_85]|nr:MAG: hypothetical protein A2Y17_08440 [Clostridiales bacterium GWF2_38_85]HBL83779.1 hypothetical protein [Clostridiales bacterium]